MAPGPTHSASVLGARHWRTPAAHSRCQELCSTVLGLSPSEPPTGWFPLYGVLPRTYAVGASVSELATKLTAAERLTEH